MALKKLDPVLLCFLVAVSCAMHTYTCERLTHQAAKASSARSFSVASQVCGSTRSRSCFMVCSTHE